MKAVIMAAGASTRTHPLTLTRPKPLLPVANRAILDHQLDALRPLVDEVIIIVHYMRDQIEERFGHMYKGIRLRYIEQGEPLGTGHAIHQCQGAIDEPFIAMNGDDLYDPADLARLAELDQGALAISVEDPRMYGVYETDSAGNAIRLVEKPEHPKSNLVNVGVYKFTPDVFEVLRTIEPSERGEIEITSAVQALAEAGPFPVVGMNGYWLPIGYAWHLLDANAYVLEHLMEPALLGDVSPGAEINGKVYIGEGAIIRSGVVIDGPACIGPGATLGPNCWIRPGTTLGRGSHVGHGVEIKNSVIMDGAKVPHLSYIGDSVVGENTNLGAGTITANFRHDGKNIQSAMKGSVIDSGRRKFGAIIGDDVHTGINTAIYPGRKLWPHTLTFPGEAVRKDVTEVKRRPPRD